MKMKKTDLETNLKRALADYQNLEKRHQTDRLAFAKFAAAGLIKNLLPALDDLERAQTHLKEKGLQLAIDQFKSALKAAGVEEIAVLGKAFDPHRAECTEMVSGVKNQVIFVIIKGYTLNGRVLRPARVKVGNGVFAPPKN